MVYIRDSLRQAGMPTCCAKKVAKSFADLEDDDKSLEDILDIVGSHLHSLDLSPIQIERTLSLMKLKLLKIPVIVAIHSENEHIGGIVAQQVGFRFKINVVKTDSILRMASSYGLNIDKSFTEQKMIVAKIMKSEISKTLKEGRWVIFQGNHLDDQCLESVSREKCLVIPITIGKSDYSGGLSSKWKQICDEMSYIEGIIVQAGGIVLNEMVQQVPVLEANLN